MENQNPQQPVSELSQNLAIASQPTSVSKKNGKKKILLVLAIIFFVIIFVVPTAERLYSTCLPCLETDREKCPPCPKSGNSVLGYPIGIKVIILVKDELKWIIMPVKPPAY